MNSPERAAYIRIGQNPIAMIIDIKNKTTIFSMVVQKKTYYEKTYKIQATDLEKSIVES